MAGLMLIIGLLLVPSMLIYGALCRIADAIEKQNEHYGIGKPKPTIVNFGQKDPA